jgi:glycerol uptake facilitator-like aquaporin
MAERMAGGNVAVALLSNTIATAGALFTLISILGPVSGAHFNPVVTVAEAVRDERTWGEVPGYILAQVAGGISGAILANAMFSLSLVSWSRHVRSWPAQLLSEVVATGGLILTIFLGVRFCKDRVPQLVAAFITAAYWFTASTSFANPAVAIARMFSDSFAGIRPLDVPGFIAAEIVGTVVGLFCISRLVTPSAAQTSTNRAERSADIDRPRVAS